MSNKFLPPIFLPLALLMGNTARITLNNANNIVKTLSSSHVMASERVHLVLRDYLRNSQFILGFFTNQLALTKAVFVSCSHMA